MAYHLIDEVKGVNDSKRVVHTTEYFKSMIQFLQMNKDSLYGFIDGLDTDKIQFYQLTSIRDTKRALHKLSYHDWRLDLIDTEEKSVTGRRLDKNYYSKSFIRITPLNNINRKYTTFMDNGIPWFFIKNNTKKEERKIIEYAEMYRVLHTTSKAVLVQFIGKKGTVRLWIPKDVMK